MIFNEINYDFSEAIQNTKKAVIKFINFLGCLA